jgi:type I restriction enzyme S subunit
VSALVASDMPRGWQRRKLGDCMRLINGRAYSQHELLDEGTPIIRIQNLNGGDRWYYSDLVLPEDKYCSRGDLLFAWSASFGPYIWNGDRSIYHYHIWRIVPFENTHKQFAFHLLEWITERVKAASHGVAMLHMTKAGMEAWEIPLPPLEEQRRIAAILDQAETLRTQRRQALAHLDTLTQSLFLDMFGDPATNPNSWPVKTLKELGKVITGGTPPSSKEGMFDGPIPFMTPGDLESDAPVRRSITEAGAKEVDLVRAGSTLVCCIGATIGKVGMAQKESAFNQQLNAVVWGNEINDHFGYEVMRFFKPTIVSWGASTTLPILKKSSFERIEIPVPRLYLQEIFASRLQKISDLKGLHKSALADLDELFGALQSKAFAGEL